jgi:hypothetical protein
MHQRFTRCTYVHGGRFATVEVGTWDFTQTDAPASGRSNQGVGTGTFLRNTAAEHSSTIASDSAVGRVARKGNAGLFVLAGNYGQFSGQAALRELASEDSLEHKLVAELLPRV